MLLPKGKRGCYAIKKGTELFSALDYGPAGLRWKIVLSPFLYENSRGEFRRPGGPDPQLRGARVRQPRLGAERGETLEPARGRAAGPAQGQGPARPRRAAGRPAAARAPAPA